MESRLIVSRNVANLYAKPTTKSEVVSQAVLGEMLTAQRKQGEFYFVRTSDLYTGWVRERSVVDYGGAVPNMPFRQTCVLFAEVYRQANAASEIITRLPIGSRVALLGQRQKAFLQVMLPDLTSGWVMVFALASPQFSPGKELSQWATASLRESLIAGIGEKAVAMGKRLTGTPYLWGGKSPFGIDCSGYTQLCYRLGAGVELLRDCSLQIKDPRFAPVGKDGKFDGSLLQDGDLVFLKGGVNHVGMVAENQLLHAAGGIGVVRQTLEEVLGSYKLVGTRRLSLAAPSLTLKQEQPTHVA